MKDLTKEEMAELKEELDMMASDPSYTLRAKDQQEQELRLIAMIERRDRAIEELRQALMYVSNGGAYDYLHEMDPLESGKCYARDAVASVDRILKEGRE